MMMKNFFQKLMGHLIPNRIKRIFLMSVMLDRLLQHRLDDETLRRANEVLAICSNYSAMKLPLSYSHTLWDGEIISESNQEFNRRELSKDNLLSKIPCWLKYEQKEMVRDIMRVMLAIPSIEAK